ncbi:MAG TPA: group II intron reverse transcriptase/maturase [Steroidobacteraceae bacterium]|nr:group II intron reverse transcriptase/maturase [Steroidobacteraceae bacterium]
MSEVYALERELMEQICARENLIRAWQRVKANQGAAGFDEVSVPDFPAWAREHWPMIKKQLREGTYQPNAVRRVWIPKANGAQRPLGIPCVADRVIQQAIAQVIGPIFEGQFSDYSFGFRPGRSAHQAVKHVRDYVRRGYKQVVDIDLAAFFDCVNHDVLMRLLARQVKDKRVLKLIGRYLRAGVMVDGVKHPTPVGVPQGGPLSPLLANIVLHELDVYLEAQDRHFARYADDFVICVRSSSAAQRVKAHVTRFLKQRLKLNINHDKSRVVPSKQLEFLGFCFKGAKIIWSDTALQRFKHRVRQLTARSWGVSMEHRYKELRRYVVGWLNYFALSEYYRPIPALDEWLRRRIRTCYWKQWRRARTKVRHLVALGIALSDAIQAGMSSKGPYRMSRTKVTQMAMSNQWLKQQGLVSIKDHWSRFHYSASTA